MSRAGRITASAVVIAALLALGIFLNVNIGAVQIEPGGGVCQPVAGDPAAGDGPGGV